MAGSQFQTYAYKHLTVALCLVFIFGLVIIFSGALDTDDTGDLTIQSGALGNSAYIPVLWYYCGYKHVICQILFWINNFSCTLQ